VVHGEPGRSPAHAHAREGTASVGWVVELGGGDGRATHGWDDRPVGVYFSKVPWSAIASQRLPSCVYVTPVKAC
jgi:hypothetical protein